MIMVTKESSLEFTKEELMVLYALVHVNILELEKRGMKIPTLASSIREKFRVWLGE